MQITEASSDGLKRKLKVVVGSAEIGDRMSARLTDLKETVQFKGFRKGKVPVDHIRKVYGRSLMGEVLQETIRDTSSKAIKERKERAAAVPEIELAKDSEIEKVFDGKADLSYEMSFEVLPEIKIADFEKLNLERLVCDVDDASLNKALAQLAERNVTFTEDEGAKAATGDRVTIDYKGSIDGVAFDGGEGQGLSLVLGSANFIPGFEEGLVGTKAGQSLDVSGRFPDAYPVKDLATKDAVFAVTVNKVEKPSTPAIDEDFAKGLGAEGLDNLKELVSAQIKTELDGAARMKLKRELLDALEKAHDFELPPSLVAREFDIIWNQLTKSMEAQGKTLADEGKTEDEAKAEYRLIAERRVRLGLVVGEIGDKNRIEVTQDELRRALMEQARRYPGQEKFVYQYFEKTPGALQELRAPIFEDKVVDFIINAAKPAEKKVSREELLKQVDEVTQS
jgi:trigger factor